MAAFNKFQKFVDGLFKGAVNLTNPNLKVMLTNTAPSATNVKYSDISASELASGNGYQTGGSAVTGAGLTNANGTETLSAQPTVFTANTGTMGPFRYIVYYDVTSGYLIGYYDYGQVANLDGTANENFTITPQNNTLMTAA